MVAVSTAPEHARKPASTPLPGRFTPSNYPHDFLKTQKLQARGTSGQAAGEIACVFMRFARCLLTMFFRMLIGRAYDCEIVPLFL